VTKSPAKRAAPAKKAAGKAARSARKASASKSAKPAAKSVARPAAKPKPVKKPSAVARKPAPKAKPVAKGASKAAAKPSAKPAVKPAAGAARTSPKPVAKAPAPTASKPVAASHKPAAGSKEVSASVTKNSASSNAKPAASAQPVLNQPPPRMPARAAARNPVPVAAPLPEPAQVSRFADRFAPTRPATRPIAVDEPVRPSVKIDPKLVNAWKGKAGRDLSEPELLAMPDAEYMNDKQLEFFRTRLTALKDDLLSNAGETTEHLREDTSIVPDPADRATIEEEHALELRTRDRERKLLKKISQSLARIEAGDYGYCDETGEPIGLARLLARPTATLSLEAQQRREMKQKMFGD
jgi:DnaK suppressor protein